MAKSAAKVKIKLTRDYWPEADVRVKAGEVIEVAEADAKTVIASGLAVFEGVAEEPVEVPQA